MAKGIDNIFNIFDVEERPTGLVVLFACRYAIITRHTKSPRKKKKGKLLFFSSFSDIVEEANKQSLCLDSIFIYIIFFYCCFFFDVNVECVKKERNSPQRVGG